jgi:hypothetical protein
VVTPLVTAACIGSSDFCIDTGRRISLEPQEGDTLLEDTRVDIRHLFRASLDGPRALLASACEYLHVLKGVGPLYVEQFRASHPYLADWAQTVESFRREELEIQSAVPSSVNFGVFKVCICVSVYLCICETVRQ